MVSISIKPIKWSQSLTTQSYRLFTNEVHQKPAFLQSLPLPNVLKYASKFDITSETLSVTKNYPSFTSDHYLTSKNASHLPNNPKHSPNSKIFLIGSHKQFPIMNRKKTRSSLDWGSKKRVLTFTIGSNFEMKVIFLYLGKKTFSYFSFFIFFSNERPKDIKIERKEQK